MPQVTAAHRTDVWGNAIGSETGSNHRFCGGLGHTTDSDTGLIYMRARYYDPQIGRFISEDTWKDGSNWYAYCDNNPVNRTDIDGHLSAWGWFEAIIGVVLEGIGAALIAAGAIAIGVVVVVIGLVAIAVGALWDILFEMPATAKELSKQIDKQNEQGGKDVQELMKQPKKSTQSTESPVDKCVATIYGAEAYAGCYLAEALE